MPEGGYQPPGLILIISGDKSRRGFHGGDAPCNPASVHYGLPDPGAARSTVVSRVLHQSLTTLPDPEQGEIKITLF